MNDVCDSPVEVDLWPHLLAIDAAYRAAPLVAGHGQGPLVAESRDLLRLFVQIGNDEVRSAIVDLIRTMVHPPLTSDAPTGPHPTDANRPARGHRP